jgi:hypothetical protein
MGDRERRKAFQRIDYTKWNSDGVKEPLLSDTPSEDETLLADTDSEDLRTDSHSDNEFLTANEDGECDVELDNVTAVNDSQTVDAEVDNELRSTETFNMSDPQVAKVSGELSGLVFQVEEILEELKSINSLGLEVLRGHLEELKVLRINIVKVSSELKLLMSANNGGGEGVLPAAAATDTDVSA